MENNNRKLLCFKDVIIIVLLLGLALGAHLLRGLGSESAGTAFAVISQDGAVIEKIPLNASGEYRYQEIHGMVFTVSEGKISVTESGCGDRTCIRTGTVSRSGEAIICAPNRVAVTIENGAESDVDVVLR